MDKATYCFTKTVGALFQHRCFDFREVIHHQKNNVGEVACVPNASTFQTDAFLDLHPAPEGYPGEAALFTAESKAMRGMFWEEDSWAWSFCGMFDATHVDAELNGELFAKGSKMKKGNLAAGLPPLALLFRKLVYRIVGQVRVGHTSRSLARYRACLAFVYVG